MAGHTRGTGSYYLRGNVYWISYWVNGRQVKESTRSGDEAEAKRQLKVKVGEAAAGKDITPERATIDDLCSLVLSDYRLRKLRDIANVKWRIEAHIKPAIGSLFASRFTPYQVRAYVDSRRKESASDATINRELAILRRGFSLALREEPPIVRRAPYIPKLEEDNVRQGFIERAQYLALRDALPEHLKALLVVGYYCGNRLGELRKLQWSQVDMEAKQIRIERKQAKGKAPRTLPIYGDMEEWLERQRELCKGDRVFCWKQSSTRVQAKEKAIGSHLKGWAEACASVGLEGLHFHDLRRSAVRNMERAGVPRGTAMRFTGHKSESVYKRYDIVVEADLEAASQKLTEFHNSQEAKAQLRRVK